MKTSTNHFKSGDKNKMPLGTYLYIYTLQVCECPVFCQRENCYAHLPGIKP